MISKELLSEVLGQVYIDATRSIKDENKHFAIGNKHVLLGDKGFNHWNDSINIYELAYKCKVWATENKYTILTEDMYPNGYFAYVLSNKESIENYGYLCEHKVIKDIPHNKTEPEAIFRACQWILDNRN